MRDPDGVGEHPERWMATARRVDGGQTRGREGMPAGQLSCNHVGGMPVPAGVLTAATVRNHFPIT